MRCGFGACSGQYGEILNASFELDLYRIEYVAETEAVYLFLCLLNHRSSVVVRPEHKRPDGQWWGKKYCLQYIAIAI